MNILDEARRLRNLIEQMAENLDDEQAEQNPNVFPLWAIGVEYEVDYKIRYKDVVYKVLQAHTSQEDWTPDTAVSLYVKVHKQDPHEYPEWVQPTGSHDAYNKDDIVKHNEKLWISLIDANVWEPGATGTEALWSEYKESENAETVE